jgi:hypothetical protein
MTRCEWRNMGDVVSSMMLNVAGGADANSRGGLVAHRECAAVKEVEAELIRKQAPASIGLVP